MRTHQGQSIFIPGGLNIFLCILACSLDVYLLKTASTVRTWQGLVVCAIAFSFVNNTVFSLLHEAVHKTAHENQAINDWIGRVTAAFFPTGFTFQRACHLSHHRHNRTDHEMFDSYYPHDNKFLKYLQLYFVIIGVYWTNPPTGALIYLFYPRLFNARFLRNRESAAVTHMGADAMITEILKTPRTKTKLEIVFTILVQAAIIYFFHISFWAWIVCYWAFAVNWGALQYADHAWSVRDIRNGAWNLRVNKIVQFIFLNYHHHLAHHQNPNVPWIHLHKFVDFKQARPSFLKIYLKLWRGPTPATEPAPSRIDPELERLLH